MEEARAPQPGPLLPDPTCRPPELCPPAAAPPTSTTTALDEAGADLVGQPPAEDNYGLSDEEIAGQRCIPVPAPTAEEQRRRATELARRRAMADESTRRLDEIMARDRARRAAEHPSPPPRPAATSEPAQEARDSGPYFDARVEHTEHGTPIGAVVEGGVFDRASTETPRGEVLEGSLLNGSAGVGRWTDREGHTNYGFRFAGQTVQGSHPSEEGNVALTGPAAEAGIWGNEDMASISFQASVGEASFEGGGEPTRESDTDTNLRIAGSYGPGAGARVYYGDRDGDGVREFGLGGDAPFGLSVDYRSEYLGQAWNAARDWYTEE